MNKSLYYRLSRFSLLILCMTLWSIGCTNLSGEPEVVATIPPATATPENTDLGYPISKPELQQGAAIFAARCTACHGAGGQGNGEFVLSGEVENPGDFTEPEFIASKDPDDYFNIITNGNLEKLMPPWRNELTEAERWAVALYTYTLHYDADRIAEGKQIYITECAQCHGETGAGDGPELVESAREVNDLSNPQNTIFLSDSNIRNIIIEGAGVNMPAYADTLTAGQISAVVAYTRTLSLANFTPSLVEQESESTAEPIISVPGIISGSISNGTEDGQIPEDLTVILHIFDADMNEQTQETGITENQRFSFADVTVRSDYFYFVSAEHQGRDFATQPFKMEPNSPEFEIPLLIYDVTNDPENIVINQILTQITPAGQVLQFDQEIRLSNTSDRVYITDEIVGADRQVSVKFQLPVGAVLVPNQNNLIYDEATFTIYDTRAVLPDTDYMVSMTYLVPYSGSAIIEYPLDYRLDGLVVVLIGSEEITVTSDQLEYVDPTAVPNLENTAYGSALTLNPGEFIRFELNGGAAPTAISAPDVVATDNLIPILIGAGIVIFAGIGALIYFSRQRFADIESRAIDALTQQIANLDSAHDRGEINHDLYQRRKAELNTQLQNLLNAAPNQGGQAQDE